jgi:hypothetical protein
MAFYVALTGFEPAPNYEGDKWLTADILESPAPVAGVFAWTEIDEKPVPDYPNAADPPPFSFSTNNATASSGKWYMVVFHNAEGGVQESVPAYNGDQVAAVPSLAWVRETSNIAFGEFGYPVPVEGPDRLRYVLDEAIYEFQGLTGIDPAALPPTDLRVPHVKRAIRMLVEFNAARSQPEILDSAVDFDLVQSMSADGYSETRRSLSQNSKLVHPWPALAALLTMIGGMDDDGVVDPDAVQVDGPGLVTMGREPRPYDHVQPEPVPGLVDVSGVYWPRTGYQPDGFEG